jgi:hypothetical protein
LGDVWGIAAVAFGVFTAGIAMARRKLPGVVKEKTIGACAAWMFLFGALGSMGKSTIGHWRAGGKVVHGTIFDGELGCAIGMAIGLVLWAIPAVGRWWRSRQPSAISRQ